MSTLAPICDHCGFSRGGAGEADIARFRERKLRDRIYRLNMTSYAVMTAMIIAFVWYWLDTAGFQRGITTYGPFYLMAVSAVAYLVVRALLFQARQQKKKIRRNG